MIDNISKSDVGLRIIPDDPLVDIFVEIELLRGMKLDERENIALDLNIEPRELPRGRGVEEKCPIRRIGVTVEC